MAGKGCVHFLLGTFTRLASLVYVSMLLSRDFCVSNSFTSVSTDAVSCAFICIDTDVKSCAWYELCYICRYFFVCLCMYVLYI